MGKELLVPDFIFESSWEVCNKVGGIYTVLSTRAKTLQEKNKDHIIFIGPDCWHEKESPYFDEDKTLFSEWREAAFEEGLKLKVGRWNVPGRPIAILVDFDDFYAVVYHANEWMTGLGLLYIKCKLPQIATVFTTHATSIGRSIAGNNKPLYDYLFAYNGDQMAQELNMQSKHSIEKQTAKYVDCFTTVSDITAKECLELLDKPVDKVLPNGFDNNFVPKGNEFTKKRYTFVYKTKGVKNIKGYEKGSNGTKGKAIIDWRYKMYIEDVFSGLSKKGVTIKTSGLKGIKSRVYTIYLVNENPKHTLTFKGIRMRKVGANYQTLMTTRYIHPGKCQRIMFVDNGANGEYGVMNFDYFNPNNNTFMTR